MSRQDFGTRPVTLVEIDLDWVLNAPGPTNPDGTPCFRTPATTQVEPLVLGTRTRRFCTSNAKQVWTMDAVPCVSTVRVETAKLTIGESLGSFGQVTVTLEDFADDDRLEDPYFTSRTEHTVGSYFSRLAARNPYVQGRSMRITEADDALMARAAFTIANQRQDGRITMRFTLNMRDGDLDLGQVVRITTQDLVDPSGQPLPTFAIVIARMPDPKGLSVEYTVEQFPFVVRYAYVMPNTQTASYAATPEAQRDPGWFLSNPDGSLPGGDPFYALS